MLMYVESVPLMRTDPHGLGWTPPNSPTCFREWTDKILQQAPGGIGTVCQDDAVQGIIACCNAHYPATNRRQVEKLFSCMREVRDDYVDCVNGLAPPPPPPPPPPPGTNPNLPPLPFPTEGKDCIAACQAVSAYYVWLCILQGGTRYECATAIAEAEGECMACCSLGLGSERTLECAQEYWLEVIKSLLPKIDPKDPTTWPRPDLPRSCGSATTFSGGTYSYAQRPCAGSPSADQQ